MHTTPLELTPWQLAVARQVLLQALRLLRAENVLPRPHPLRQLLVESLLPPSVARLQGPGGRRAGR